MIFESFLENISQNGTFVASLAVALGNTVWILLPYLMD